MSKTFLEALTSVGKNLQSGVDKLNETSVDNIYNIACSEISSSSASDLSDSIQTVIDGLVGNKKAYFPDGNYNVTSAFCRNNKEKICGSGKLVITDWTPQWDSISKTNVNIFGNTCDISKIGNKYYDAVHYPGEAVRVGDTRLNVAAATSTNGTITSDFKNITTQGYITINKDKTYPESFTLCIGKLNLLGYKNGEWVKLLSKLPLDAKMFNANWNGESLDVEGKTIVDGHIELPLTGTGMYDGTTRYVIHFYHHAYDLALTGEDYSDYKYFMSTADVWMKEEGYDDIFSVVIGIDLRDSSSRVFELGLSKPYCITSNLKTAIFHTVKDEDFDEVIGDSFNLDDAYPLEFYTKVYSKKMLLPPHNTLDFASGKIAKICEINFADTTPANDTGRVIANVKVQQTTSSDIYEGEFVITSNQTISNSVYTFTNKIHTLSSKNAKAGAIMLRRSTDTPSKVELYTCSQAWSAWTSVIVTIELFLSTRNETKLTVSYADDSFCDANNPLAIYSTTYINKAWETGTVDSTTDTTNTVS